MSRKRQDPARARQRRERIRSEKHARRTGLPMDTGLETDALRRNAFAMERAMREVAALTEGQSFNSVEELNASLEELTGSGGLSEKAQARKQDDPRWRAQEIAYDAMETDHPLEALELVSEALELDPECIDAQRLMVSLMPMELDNQIRLMREVVESAEQRFGERFFEEHMGEFWHVLSTRPYMRARQAWGELLIAGEELEEASTVLERTLELNPDDNQGVRYCLLSLYLATGRGEAARALIVRYPGEEEYCAVFAWGIVMEHWLAGRAEEAEAALRPARRVNPHVERYLTGARRLPERLPSHYRPGEESEAQVAAYDLLVASKGMPGFAVWLRGRR